MGVRPDQVADLLALKGDAIDNIPGAPGIGDKGAQDLIERFGSVEAALEHAAEVERKAYRESLQNNVEQIRMSKRLATIATDVPVEFELDAVQAQKPDEALLKALYKEMEFHSLLKELGPEEDTRARDYARNRRTRASSSAGCGGARTARPSQWRLRQSARRRVCAGHHRAGLAPGRGARRTGRSAWSDCSPGSKTPARPKIACDVKRRCWPGALGIEGAASSTT